MKIVSSGADGSSTNAMLPSASPIQAVPVPNVEEKHIESQDSIIAPEVMIQQSTKEITVLKNQLEQAQGQPLDDNVRKENYQSLLGQIAEKQAEIDALGSKIKEYEDCVRQMNANLAAFLCVSEGDRDTIERLGQELEKVKTESEGIIAWLLQQKTKDSAEYQALIQQLRTKAAASDERYVLLQQQLAGDQVHTQIDAMYNTLFSQV